jgi:anthranilate phosphoribosyltransferase
VENGEVSTHHIDPQEFGIEPIVAKEEMSLEAMKELMNNPDENLVKMIQLNAAFIGFAAGMFETIEQGFKCLQD